MKTRRDELRGLEWYARNPEHALHGMRNLTLEQTAIYGRTLDQIYMTGDRLEDLDARQAAANNCHLRVYRRVKAELIDMGKLFIEESDGVMYLRNERASAQVVKERLLVESKVQGGQLGGEISARRRGQELNKNKGPSPRSASSRPSSIAQAELEHPYLNPSSNLSDRLSSTPAREGSAAQPEGRASPSAPDLTAHPNSAVRAFAATLEPDELAQWSAYQGTIEPEGKSFVVLAPSGARAGLIASHFTTKLKASLKSCTIKAPNYPDTTIT